MTIHQEVDFDCSVQEVFDALVSAEKFGTMTGAPTEIQARDGGVFSCFGGMITGMTIEMIPNARLVQAWRVKDWEPGIYSIVKFEIMDKGGEKTKLTFDHTGFPEDRKSHLEQGWHDNYWNPMKKFLKA